jgi:Ca-activated chloride channel family protein
MEVRDMPDGASRLEIALRAARELTAPLGGASGSRFALVFGKSRGVLAVPLTYDTETVFLLLDTLSGEAVTGRGTNLEALVDAAIPAFSDDLPSRRRIILFTDGEALEGNLNLAVDRAIKTGITLTILGLGTEAGGPVPPGPSGEDPAEAPVISRLHRDSLKSAAERSGGVYLEEHWEDLSPGAVSGGFRREPKSQQHIFLLAALAALGLSKLAEKKWRTRDNH